MQFNDVMQDAKDNNKYLKLNDGQMIKGYFEGEFTKTEKDFNNNGKITIKYEINFIVLSEQEPEQKVWSGSSMFFKQANDACEMVEPVVDFYNAIFKIKRTGTGMDTRYSVAVVSKKEQGGQDGTDNTEPF